MKPAKGIIPRLLVQMEISKRRLRKLDMRSNRGSVLADPILDDAQRRSPNSPET